MIQIKFKDYTNVTVNNSSRRYSPEDIPDGHILFSDYLDSILIPSEDKSMWIGFGISDNTVDVIDDNTPVEGILIKDSEVTFTV